MNNSSSFFDRHAARLAAVVLIVLFYGFTQLPQIPAAERRQLSSRFAFDSFPLPRHEGVAERAWREVHPSLDHLAGWISSVGASAALHDLDNDGLANDLCWVDPRTDSVLIAPVPGTGERFSLAALDRELWSVAGAVIAPMGCLPGDLNEDGWIDLLVYYWGRPPMAFLRRSSPTIEVSELAAGSYRAVDIGNREERWYTNALTRADLDGDGHIDLVVGNYFPDGSHLLDPTADGEESMQDSMSRAFNGGRKRLLRWVEAAAGPEPSVRFVEAGKLELDIAHGWTLAAGAADLDGDLLPELYFAHDFGPDRLLANRSRPGHVELAPLTGHKGFATPRSKVLGHDSFKGMGVDFADVDGDGHLDIYVSNIAEEYALEESHFLFLNTGDLTAIREGRAPYVERSEELGLARSGWSWESRLADFDNDGKVEAIQATGFLRGSVDRWPELHEIAMGNDGLLRHPQAWPRFRIGDDLSGSLANAFFVRSSSGRFFDLASDVGLGQPQVTRGIAVADVEGDGDLDFVFANQWQTSLFYRNRGNSQGSSLGLRLLLPLTVDDETRVYPGSPVLAARPAIGATAVLHLGDGRRQVAQVDGGNGHSGARSPELHFGLGSGIAADSKLRLEISWRDPSGIVHRAEQHLPPGRHSVVLAWPAVVEGS